MYIFYHLCKDIHNVLCLIHNVLSMSCFGYVVELLLQKVQEHLCHFLLASGIKICINFSCCLLPEREGEPRTVISGEDCLSSCSGVLFQLG